MKKLCWVLLSVWIVFALAGCGEKEESEKVSAEIVSADDESESLGEETEIDKTEAGDSAAEDTVSGEESADTQDGEEGDNDDFSYVANADGTCMLQGCYVEADVIEVPETITDATGMYTVTEIGYEAFFLCEAERIVLPDTVETIDNYAFLCCENLKEIDLGSGVKTVEENAFSDCSALETMTFPEGMETLGCNFFGCESLGEVYIPASVTEFPEGVIANIEGTPNIVIVTPAGSAAETQALADGLPVQNP